VSFNPFGFTYLKSLVLANRSKFAEVLSERFILLQFTHSS
jgi:hypothetical protein